jgi:hypothetical protein
MFVGVRVSMGVLVKRLIADSEITWECGVVAGVIRTLCDLSWEAWIDEEDGSKLSFMLLKGDIWGLIFGDN